MKTLLIVGMTLAAFLTAANAQMSVWPNGQQMYVPPKNNSGNFLSGPLNNWATPQPTPQYQQPQRCSTQCYGYGAGRTCNTTCY